MAIYSADYAGIKPGAVPSGALSLDKLRGVLLASDIERLLQDSSAVGLRVYNAAADQQGFFIIACGVDEEGFDLDGLYLMTSAANGSQIDQPTKEVDRSTARDIIINAKPILQVKGMISAFFSRNMLAQLVQGQAFGGVAFFEAGLTDFSALLVNSKVLDKNATSFIGVGALPIQNNQTGTGSSPVHVLSDLPCPGYCLNFKSDLSTDVARFGTAPSELDTAARGITKDPYLVSWQEALG